MPGPVGTPGYDNSPSGVIVARAPIASSARASRWAVATGGHFVSFALCTRAAEEAHSRRRCGNDGSEPLMSPPSQYRQKRHCTGTPEAESEAAQNHAKADIAVGMSLVRGKADEIRDGLIGRE